MYDDIPLVYVNIARGGTYTEGWNLADEGQEPLLASDGWTGKAQVRTGYGGQLLITFTDPGDPAAADGDGTLEFDEDGNVVLILPSTFTETLPQTEGVGFFVGDMDIWRTSAPSVKFKALFFRVRIYPEVTTS